MILREFAIGRSRSGGTISRCSLRIPMSAGPFTASWLLVGVLTAIWALLVAQMSITAYQSFNAVGNDLGLWNQVFWSTTHGRPFYGSLIPQTENLLGHHFAPLTVGALLPFYYVWPDARVLLIAQAVALSIGTFPLYAFALRRLSRELAILVVVVYLLSPFLAFIAFADFHATALEVPFLMAAGAALLDRRTRATLLWTGLALLIKEEVAIIAVGFGLYALIIQRRVRFGAIMTLGALGYAGLIMGVLMPTLNPGTEQYPFLERYDQLGNTPIEIAQTILTRPTTLVAILTTKPKLEYVASLLYPLAGLPLLGVPTVLLALPTLAYLLLSDYPLQFSISSYYAGSLLPFLFLSVVTALERLRKWHPRLGQVGAGALLVSALLGARMLSPLPGGANYVAERYDVRPEHKITQAALKAIPSGVAVRADWRFYPWLPHTVIKDSLNTSSTGDVPDFVVLGPRGANAVLPPPVPWLAAEFPDLAPGPLHLPRYELNRLPDGTTLGVRQPDGDVWLQRIDAPFERDLILVAAGTPPEAPEWGAQVSVTSGSILPIWLAWGASARVDQRITFTIQLFHDTEKVAQIDQEMGQGLYPTTLWHAWREQPVVVDEFHLFIPPDLPSGRYSLRAGAYQSETVEPLVRSDGSLWVELAEVVVEAEDRFDE